VLPGLNRKAADAVLVALVAAAGAAALVEMPSAFRSAFDQGAREHRLGPARRELTPEMPIGIDGSALVEATHVIPRGETYYVNASPGDAGTVRPITFYVMFPRRYVDSPRSADWVISFGSKPPKVGVALGDAIQLGGGFTAARVQR
jgi:hypothetical protein